MILEFNYPISIRLTTNIIHAPKSIVLDVCCVLVLSSSRNSIDSNIIFSSPICVVLLFRSPFVVVVSPEKWYYLRCQKVELVIKALQLNHFLANVTIPLIFIIVGDLCRKSIKFEVQNIGTWRPTNFSFLGFNQPFRTKFSLVWSIARVPKNYETRSMHTSSRTCKQRHANIMPRV